MDTKACRLFVVIVVLFTAGCGRTRIVRERLAIDGCQVPAFPCTCTEAEHERSPFITVWVHGTRLTPRVVMRRFFHTPCGLVKAADFNSDCHIYSVARALAEADPVHYPFDHLYIFGWSGELDFRARRKAARDLRNHINRLVQEQRAVGLEPRVRIITHSHGGNVALNMAAIEDKHDFVVDELILLACPVQCATAPYIQSKIFRNIFALYSSFDFIQIIDPQGIYKHTGHRPLFSERRFPARGNVMQAKVKLNGRALMHVDFIRLGFVSLLPRIVRTLHARFMSRDFTVACNSGDHCVSLTTVRA